MLVAIKADSWTEVFRGDPEAIEAYAWSPNSSHKTEGGDVPVAQLESINESVGGLESTGGLESFGGLESISTEAFSPEPEPEFVMTVIKRK